MKLIVVPFNWQDSEEQKGPGTRDQSLRRLQNKFRKVPLLSDVLPDQAWWCNIKQFLSCSKNLHQLINANQFMAS